jgi:anti-sigma B factor antagonist
MLRVSNRRLGNVVTLSLGGRLVIGETVALQKALRAETEASVIVLDLAKVTMIDAHGLGVMLALRQQAESKGTEFRLINVSRLVHRVLEITKLNSVFDVHNRPDMLRRMPLAGSPSRRELAACA